MQKDTERIMNLKATIAELHNSILTLSQGLWDISIELDDMLLQQTTQVPEPEQLINMEHTEMPPIDIPVVKAKPKQPAKPTETPTEPDVPDTLPPLPPAPRPPETAQKSPEKSLMERLLGKDAGEKAKLRAEREKELERKLAELSAPKGGAK